MKKLKKRSSKQNNDVDPLSGDLSGFLAEGGWESMSFEITEPKDRVISLRLSEKLLELVKKQAESLGLDTQKFIRIALENTVRNKKGA